MMHQQIIIYDNANPTLSDFYLMVGSLFSDFPSYESSDSTESVMSDAHSASPNVDTLFHDLCNQYTGCVHEQGKVFFSEWSMPGACSNICRY